MNPQDSQELIHYGVDESNGTDSTGLTIVKGEKMWGYIGEEADVLLALINQQVLQALESLKDSIPQEQNLTTKYGYNSDEKKYGYRLAVNDLREAIDQVATKYRGGE